MVERQGIRIKKKDQDTKHTPTTLISRLAREDFL